MICLAVGRQVGFASLLATWGFDGGGVGKCGFWSGVERGCLILRFWALGRSAGLKKEGMWKYILCWLQW